MLQTLTRPVGDRGGAADPLDRLPAEMHFLVDLCRPVRRFVHTTLLDWSIIEEAIERHGLARLVPRLLSTPDLVPTTFVAPLRELHLRQTTAALLQVQETVRLADLFDRAAIRFILIKGVALSVQLHGHPAMRASKDIDVLIDKGDVARVAGLLHDQGYERASADLGGDDRLDLTTKEIVYIHAERRKMVEIHTRLTENDELFVTDFDSLWRSRELVSVGGRALPVMEQAKLSIYLALHGTGHCWSRLMWLLDIVALTPRPADCEAALADARKHRLEPALLHTFWIMRHWLGHDVPSSIVDEANASSSVRLLNGMTTRFHNDRQWYRIAPQNSWRRFVQTSLIGRSVRYRMKSGTAYWQSQLASELVSPNDRAMVPLPPKMAWFYIIIRPFGWIIRRIRR